MWQTFLWLHLGMTMQNIGDIGFYMAPFTLAITWLSGILGDRIRPLPLMVCAMIGLVVTCPIGMLYLIPGLSAATYLWIRVVYLAVHMPIFAADGAARQPFYMSILPRERYGQYAAAMDMVRAFVARIVGTLIAGLTLDYLQKLHHGDGYYLRYVHVWSFCCEVLAVGAMAMLYYEWKKLGGKDHFVPPAAEPPRHAHAHSPTAVS
jgi:MFS family permease